MLKGFSFAACVLVAMFSAGCVSPEVKASVRVGSGKEDVDARSGPDNSGTITIWLSGSRASVATNVALPEKERAAAFSDLIAVAFDDPETPMTTVEIQAELKGYYTNNRVMVATVHNETVTHFWGKPEPRPARIEWDTNLPVEIAKHNQENANLSAEIARIRPEGTNWRSEIMKLRTYPGVRRVVIGSSGLRCDIYFDAGEWHGLDGVTRRQVAERFHDLVHSQHDLRVVLRDFNGSVVAEDGLLTREMSVR
jgi:hypothetical protein